MRKCFNCDKDGQDMYGYAICDDCKSELRLFKDSTIKGYSSEHPEEFSKEIEKRLDQVEKDYIKKKIKLLHIKEQLRSMK